MDDQTFVLVPQREYQTLIEQSELPPLPPRDDDGNVEALPYMRASMARSIIIGVGKADCFRPPLPPNRTGGSPASGSPVSGLLNEQIEGGYTSPDRPVCGLAIVSKALLWQSICWASGDGQGHDRVRFRRAVSAGCF
jgi:hypothetical protein